jgi:hypothetical protein
LKPLGKASGKSFGVATLTILTPCLTYIRSSVLVVS